MSKYYDPNDKYVFDGDTAEARDVNDVNTSVSAGFDLVEADINNIGNIGEEWAVLAKAWAISETQPEPGYESSRTYAIASGDSATEAAISAAEAAQTEANVVVAEQNAANCAAAAEAAAVEAGDKVTEAEGWANNAATSASQSQASANDAAGSATDAETAQTAAELAETGAEAGALESYHWANYPEDSPVPESQAPPEYSAYHWMQKAQAIAGGGVVTLTGLAPITVNNTDPQNPVVGWAGDATDVGLGNVDNTSDANKPVSTATQTALDDLETLLRTEFEDADTSIITNYEAADVVLQDQIDAIVNAGISDVDATAPITVDKTDPKAPLIGWAGDASDVGLENVDNTSDADKPISSDTQIALNNKENWLDNPSVDGYALVSTILGARSWVEMTGGGGGGGGLEWSLVAADAPVAKLKGLMVDTTTLAITVTIPDAPAEGDVVGVMDAAGNASNFPITIASLQFIMGEAAPWIISSDNMALRLVYSGDVQKGWRVETLTPCGGSGSGIQPNVVNGIVGTADEIDVDNTDPALPVVSISPNFLTNNPQGLKKVQRFTGMTPSATDVNITIEAVVMDKTFINKPFQMRQNSSVESITFTLIDPTTVEIHNGISDVAPYVFEVVEFY